MFLDQIEHFPEVTDTEAARIGLERWQEQPSLLSDQALADRARSIAEHRNGGRLLQGLFANSPYLTRLLIRDTGFAASLLEEGPDATETRLKEDAAALDPAALNTAELMTALRVLKISPSQLPGGTPCTCKPVPANFPPPAAMIFSTDPA